MPRIQRTVVSAAVYVAVKEMLFYGTWDHGDRIEAAEPAPRAGSAVAKRADSDYSNLDMKSRNALALLPFALALCGCALVPQRGVKAAVLDLRNPGSAVPLTGEWNALLGGRISSSAVPLRSLLPAPKAEAPETWTLTILMGGGEGCFLLVPFPAEISAVYLDSRPLWENPAGGSVPAAPRVLELPPAPSGVLRVEVPSGGRSPGGPTLAAAPFLLGSPGAVEDYRDLVSLLAGIKMGSFGGALLVALLFALISRRGRGFLSLGIYLAASLAYFLVRDASALGWLPLGSSLLDRLLSASWSLQAAGFAVLGLALCDRDPPAAVRPALVLPPLLLAGAALVPVPVLRPVHAASLVWAGLSYAGLIGWYAYRSLRGDRRAVPVLLGGILLAAAYGARLAAPDSLLLARVLEPGGAGAFTVLAFLTIIRKVGDAFEEAENLSAYVDSVSTSVKRFIPAEFMEYLQKTDVTDLKLGDHVEKEMTIFFSDIRGFTLLSESLTEEQTFAFINSYLARMVPVIKERGGFVDKYVGDAIMALFPDAGGADQALRAALEMQSRVVEYNRHRASVGYRPIEMGIGIHTGTLMLGVVGVQDRMENTVISDAVNLSSRLQAIAKAFNIGVVVSEQSFKSLEDPTLFKYRFIGKVRVKGKAAPVSCFEIFGDTQDEAFDERKIKASTYFEQGMLRYYQKDFLAGFHYFQKSLEFLPQDGASKFYMEVCWRKKD